MKQVFALTASALQNRVDLATGEISGADLSVRRLSDLRECFADEAAYQARLLLGDETVYQVASVERAGPGALSYGLGTVYPGRVGAEYFLTKGHYHAHREDAEVYIGLAGQGGLVLENEDGENGFVPLGLGQIVYVPGSTAHRSVNTADEPFRYLGVYASDAGHDYDSIATSNFQLVVVAGPEGPEAIERTPHPFRTGGDQ